MRPRTHQPCPDCGSSDGLTEYWDHRFCFVCRKNTYTEKEEELEEIQHKEITLEKPINETQGSLPRVTPLAKNFPPLSDRGIDAKAAEKYQVRAVLNDEIPNVRHVYPYFDKSGSHVGNKCRTKFQKGFFVEGSLSQAQLFGQQAFPAGGKSLTITEGECDALAAYQMFDHKYPVVSVQSSTVALKNIQDNYEYVTSFDEVVLVFDTDKPGQDAAEAVAAILPLGKTRIVKLTDGKDSNECLQKGKVKEFIRQWWAAKSWTPAGIRLGKELWADVSSKNSQETVLYPFAGFNDMTYGIRLGELVVITADTGVGKTSVIKEIEYHLLNNSSHGIGIMHLEENNRDTGLGLMSLAANKPLHLPDVRAEVSDEELKVYFDKTVNTDRVVVYDHFGSNNIEDLLNKIRHMVALGAKFIILDHLSIVVSDQSGDERKLLDEIATKIKSLTMELQISILAVIHQNRQGQIRGTAGVEQLANIVIKLFRDKESDDAIRRDVTKVLIQKNRFCGRTGPCSYLRYSPETGRLAELSDEDVKAYEQNAPKEEVW